MEKGKAALTGAGTGAAIGSVAGPIGTVAGGLIGGAIGYFAGGDDEKAPTYTPSRTNFTYGMGPADYNYAQNQSNSYTQKQGQLEALGQHAYNRGAPIQALPTERGFTASQGQSFLQGADAPGRAQQLQALGGLQGQVGRLNQFADSRMGPSAAQAQLQAGTDLAAKQQFGFARAQPGGGGAALRNAAMNAAGISGNAANSSAALLAQETAQHRAQQLQALGAAQQGAGQVAGYSGQLRGQDQGFAQVQAGQANYDAGAQNVYNQQQQQFEFGVGQNNQNAALTQGRQNDAMALGTYGMAQGYESLRNQLAQGNLAAGQSYEAARLQGAGLGAANFNAAQAQSNAETGMALGAVSSGLGTYNQMNPPAGGGGTTSDVRAKKDIKPVSVLEALGGRYDPGQTRAMYEAQVAQPRSVQSQIADSHRVNARQDVDFNADEFRSPVPAGFGVNQDRQNRLRALGGGGAPDFRNAQGYEFAYRDPEQFGQGKYVGPMAQDLENVPGVVKEGPSGMKQIDAPRLTLANTAAVSELQNELDDVRRRQEQLQALGGGIYAPSNFAAPSLKPIDYAGLDAAVGYR